MNRTLSVAVILLAACCGGATAGAPSMAERITETKRTHWSFQPITAPKLPAVSGVNHPIDRFVRQRLRKAGLKPNAPADARTLIRRAAFHLTGLPPTFSEVRKFTADSAAKAWSRVVDELLSRPGYGQRWARHWLDVARYADTTENSVDGERRIPFAHTYRDYVVDSLNRDKPFDRFVLEQMAADRLPDAGLQDLRALGFYWVGRRFFAHPDGAALRVDDRIDTVGRGFLGLTLACARCHDHKYDPVPTGDYYSLYGILASFEDTYERPEVGRPGAADKVSKHLAARKKIVDEYEAHVDACVKSSTQHFRDMATEYLEFLVRRSPNHRTTQGDIPLDTPRGWLTYRGSERWAALLESSRQADEPVFRLWHRLIGLAKESFARAAGEMITTGLTGHHPAIVAAFAKAHPTNMLAAARTYGVIIKEALTRPDSDITKLVFGPGSPVPPRDRDEIRIDLHRFLTERQLVNRNDGNKARTLMHKLTTLDAGGPIDRAMVVKPRKEPVQPVVFLRGDPKQHGAAVPRRFLQVLAGSDERGYADDGRLQLARAIASPDNPLTSRVIVNRVWQHHFGTGLVATADDFGLTGEAPSHPGLLDYLAAWFIEQGWSLKSLHHHIMTSETWRQSSRRNSAALELDAGNRLLWRMTPRHLEFEPLRDSLLHVAGRLDDHLGGRGAKLDDRHRRRTLYGYTDRFRIPALMRNFNVANPDTSIPKRSDAIVPVQALYLLNSSFVRQQAEALLERPEIAATTKIRARIAGLFRLILSRNATADERMTAMAYLGTKPDPRRWANFVQSLLLSNEFTFVD
jgi:hypothetical protein